ncbi:HET-domain-containing protein [Lophiostoma macrostomum CBS 122681]|uniref:HET-domain-containing protein n=1 Tax=Lophiostoma macrostomum CBS 122681 TaxID=1314788 RepID=A0A6A6TIH8_9PLEO|nr:HET-domain-containing protein [Lophiostoma macrostomum CBS 122681]
MSVVKVCDACQAFLRGSWTEIDKPPNIARYFPIRYKHHYTAESFQLALDLGCVVCLRLWASFRRGDISFPKRKEQVTYTGPTTFCPTMGDTLFFESPDHMHRARIQLIPWAGEDEFERPDISVSANTGDGIALDFLVSQYRQCLMQHRGCLQSARSHGFLPTRLIDVGCDGDNFIRLCQREELATERGYVVLSHCWGNHRPFTLTTSNAASLRARFPVTLLPKTFRDAIVVTRKFQHRYLWIDSLCIIQDDVDDWRTESAAMRDVYGSAAFCIAATAAEDSSTGLFVDRDLTNRTPVKVRLTPETSRQPNHNMLGNDYSLGVDWVSSHQVIDGATLNQRAWVILHFAREVLYWECGSSFSNETHRAGLFRSDIVNYQPEGVLGLKKFLGQHKQLQLYSPFGHITHAGSQAHALDVEELYYRWCKFREFYTSCRLTNGDDTLAALHGIAQDVAEALQNEMVAGLWKNHLLLELCWHVSSIDSYRPRPSKQYPSWSWISSTHRVHGLYRYATGAYFLGDSPHHMAIIERILADDKEFSDSGRASLLLRSRLIHTSFRYNSEPYADTVLCDTTDELLRCAVVVHPDDPASADNIDVEVDCCLLILRYHPDPHPPGFHNRCSEAEGLVVVPCEDIIRGYRRIGYWRIMRSGFQETFERADILDAYKREVEQIIELV